VKAFFGDAQQAPDGFRRGDPLHRASFSRLRFASV